MDTSGLVPRCSLALEEAEGLEGVLANVQDTAVVRSRSDQACDGKCTKRSVPFLEAAVMPRITCMHASAHACEVGQFWRQHVLQGIT